MAGIDKQRSQLGALQTGPITASPTQPTLPAADPLSLGGVFTKDSLVKSASAASPQAPAKKHEGFFSHLLHDVEGIPADIKKGFSALIHGARHLATGVSTDVIASRKIEADPSDVNNPTSDEVSQATQEIADNKAKEQASLAKLPADAQKEYQTVMDQTSDRPMARRALQTMLLDGRLPGQKAIKGQGTLLNQLNTLATQPLAKGVDRKTVTSDVISEVENPVRIDQHQKTTCGPTTGQILLARKNPAEYVRIVAGLATPAGSVQLAGGDTVKRAPDWNNTNDGGRTTSSQLFQPALMSDGDRIPGLSYNNSADKNKELFIPLGGGLTNGGEAHVNSQLQGVPYKTLSFWAWNRDSHWNQLKGDIAQGRSPIPVGLSWNIGDGPGGHFVQIDKIDKGTVYYTNPWGSAESMSEADFKSHITGAEIPSK